MQKDDKDSCYRKFFPCIKRAVTTCRDWEIVKEYGMAINQEKKQYILRHLDHYIDELVWNVLGNDPEDPHYSAVTATNCIKCYIELCGELGENPP